MPSSYALLAAGSALLFVSSASAHMIMSHPVPYDSGRIDNSPLRNDGSDYPCKLRPGVYDITTMNNMAVGEEQLLDFKGSAVHGGGSCQLVVTLDQKPTKDSKFKVVHSIIGGCPGVGSGANSYKFKLPPSIPNGQMTFAWTWIDILAGQKEFYMNCAPITVTGGASDTSAFDKLPDMYQANLAIFPDQVTLGALPVYPTPGDSVEYGAGAPGSGASGSAAGAPAATSAAANNGAYTPVAASSAVPVASSAAASSKPAATSSAVVASSSPASSSAPKSSSAAGSPTSQAAAPSAKPSYTTPSTFMTMTGSAPAATAAPTAGAYLTSGSKCDTNGALVCNGPTQFGLCNFGTVAFQPVAPGTQCVNGQIVAAAAPVRRHARGFRFGGY